MKIEVGYCNGCNPLTDHARVTLNTVCPHSEPADGEARDSKYRVVVCRYSRGCEYPRTAFPQAETFFITSPKDVKLAVNDLLAQRKRSFSERVL